MANGLTTGESQTLIIPINFKKSNYVNDIFISNIN